MNEETILAEELSALADGSAPPSTVDVHGAVRRGRGRLLRRRVALVVTAASAVVACSAALALVLPGGGRAADPAVLPTTSVSPSPSGVHTWNPIPQSSGPAVTPSETRSPAPVTGTDPLISDARFGWLPDSVKTLRYMREANGQEASALGELGEFPTPSFGLKVFPAGVTPALPTLADGKPNLPGYKPGNHAIRVDAPQVNGREAYWITASDPNMAETMNTLRWKTAEGRWAELDSGSLSEADKQRIPLKVAAGVTTGHWQVPLPLRISNLPAAYTVNSVSLRQARDGSDFSLDLSIGSSTGAFIGVTVKPDVPDTVRTGPDGMPHQPESTRCTSENGVKACVTALGNEAHVFDAAGGAQGLLDRFTLFGTDPATWNTAVRD
ncbi:hypothetical protein [Kitasatospora arboriphila]|uniref:hypothetical protein n=1 Tax=Kitasatospora arboriphila TaxID=258052 RepID=UPI0031E325FA